MTLKMIENTQEISIMRAIGASIGPAMRIVIVEVIVTSLISWFFGVRLAYPLDWSLSEIMGSGFPITNYSYLE